MNISGFDKLMQNVDWTDLVKQKELLVELCWNAKEEDKLYPLNGIIHLLDELQDTAEHEGLWSFPEIKS